MEHENSTNHENGNDANRLLAAGASWMQREYVINFSEQDYFKAQTQMKEQDERKDDIILLKIDYDVMNGKAIIVDKVCTCR